MRRSVKTPVAPCEYIEWALSIPKGARYDLSRSGMSDAITSDLAAQWQSSLDLEAMCRRDTQAQAYQRLIEQISARYDVAPQHVVPTVGASQAIMQVLLAVVRPGDHVVVERPTYEPLHRVPELLGAEVSRLERKSQEDWAVLPERLAKLLTPRTRAVVLSNLHNPTGVALDPSVLEAVGEMAGRVGALLLCDEVYLDFTGEGPPLTRSAARVVDNGVSWSSMSKGFGFGALRVGWMVAHARPVADALRSAAAYLHMTLPSTSLWLAAHVLADAETYIGRASRLADSGRRIVNRWVEADRRVRWVAPKHGLTGLIQLPALMSDRRFAEHLRDRYDTQVVPGSMFEAEGCVRLSFGLGEAELEQALANVSDALDDLAS